MKRLMICPLFAFVVAVMLVGADAYAAVTSTNTFYGGDARVQTAGVYMSGAATVRKSSYPSVAAAYAAAIGEAEANATSQDGTSKYEYHEAWSVTLSPYCNAEFLSPASETVTIDLTDYPLTNGYIDAQFLWKTGYIKQDSASGTSYQHSQWCNYLTTVDSLAVGQTNSTTAIFVTDWVSSFGPGSEAHCIIDDALAGYRWMTVHVVKQEADVQTGQAEEVEVHDPIGTITRKVDIKGTDIVVPAPGMPLEFKRTYISQLGRPTCLGENWTHNYDWSIWETNTVFGDVTNSWVVLQVADKETWKAVNTPTNGGYFAIVTTEGSSAPLVASAGGGTSAGSSSWSYTKDGGLFTVTLPEGLVCNFNSSNVLSSIEDPFGNSVTLSYTNTGTALLVDRVDHSTGLALEFIYTNDLLAALSSPSEDLSMTYSYDASDRLTNMIRTCDGAQYPTTYFYAPSGDLITQKVNAAGHLVAWEYDGDCGNYSVVRDGASTWLEGTIVPSEDVTNRKVVTYRRGDTNIVYYYDSDPLIKQLRGVYGPNSTAGSGARGERYHRNQYGDLLATEYFDRSLGAEGGAKLKMTYDSQHRMLTRGYAYGLNVTPTNLWKYTWNDEWETLASVEDPVGARVEYDYTNGQVSKVSLMLDETTSHDTTYAYNSTGLVASVTNANGHWVAYDYDEYGRLSLITPELGPSISFSNNVLGFTEEITMPGDSGERVTTFDVDAMGRINSILYPDLKAETFSYDPLGNLTNHTDRAGRSTTYTYAPTRKLTSVVRHLAGGGTVTNGITYDKQFNSLSITDANGREVEAYTLDLQDRPVTVSNVEGDTMTVEYGLKDYVKSVTRFDGSAITNHYDSDGRQSQMQFPDDTLTMTYLSNDLVKTIGDASGIITNEYDVLNRLTSMSGIAPADASVSYGYLPAGQLASATSLVGVVDYTYDAAERIDTITAPDSTFTYTYNTNNGLVATMTCTNSGVNASYAYDIMDRLTSITWRDAGDVVLRSFTYDYDAAGMITNVVYQDGKSTKYGYDSLDRLTGETRRGTNSAVLADVDYTFDEVGNRLTKAQGGSTLTYSYPTVDGGNNRLSSWSASSVTGFSTDVYVGFYAQSTETIGTNAWLGQLWVSNTTAVVPNTWGTHLWLEALEVSVGTQTVVAAASDEAGNVGYATNTVVISVATNGAYLYNAAGCLTNVTTLAPGATQTLDIAWNSQYQVTNMAIDGSVVESYTYDPLGRRISIEKPGETNYLIYDGAQVIAEVDVDGTLQRTYTWGPGIDNLLSFTVYSASETNTYYTLTDHLGSVHAVTDESGDVVESYDYDAWGRVLGVYDGDGAPLVPEATLGNRYLWQGREYSWDTGMYYFRARWYDPVTGRWLSKDPIGIAGGLNQYVFCGDNPVNFVDPWGLQGRWDNPGGWALGRDIRRWQNSLAGVRNSASSAWQWASTGVHFGVDAHGSMIVPYSWEVARGLNVMLSLNDSVRGGYTYSEKDDCGRVLGASGFDAGVSAQWVLSFGHGSWSGNFDQLVINAGWYTASLFHGEGQWGVSFGASSGVPGVALETTRYRRRIVF